MPDWPRQGPAVLPPLIHTMSRLAGGGEARMFGATASAGVQTWVANLAIYVPIAIPYPYPVRRVFWVNGSTASSNADFAILTRDGKRIYSTGSTAQSGASVPQFVTPSTPFILAPGRYYFGWACSGTTSRAFGLAPSAAVMRLAGCWQEAAALPIPADATGASVTNALLPLCGITRFASGF